MSSWKAVPKLVDKLQQALEEHDQMLKDAELEAQVQEKLAFIKDEIGRLESMVSKSVSGKARDEAAASGEWAELRVEDKILQESEVMSRLSAIFHRLTDPKLKMCLVSLSVFSDTTPIKKRPLIYWWMGEGLVPTEEAGERMFEEILSLEGFTDQAPPKSLTLYPWTRRMLLMHAQEIDFLKYISYPQLTPCDGLRRAFLRRGDIASDVGGGRVEDLVSVFNVSEQYLGSRLEWMSRLQKVEVLQLGRWQGSVTHHIEVENSKRLFKGLGSAQKHLKYFSLRGVARIESLPASIGKLPSLQILDLRACHNLEKLPESISNLKKLTHLDVSECYLVDCMPKGLPNLSNLRVLKGFICSKNSCKVADLVDLKHLRKLSIRLGNQDSEDLTCLANFPGLHILTISWRLVGDKEEEKEEKEEEEEEEEEEEKNKKEEEELETLIPVSLPESLTKLDLRYVPFKAVPDWLDPNELPPGLKKLYITGGKLYKITEVYKQASNGNPILRFKHLGKLDASSSN